MDKEIEKLSGEVKALREKVLFFDKAVWVTGIVAVVFGITGAWGANAIVSANNMIADMERQIESASARVASLEQEIDDAESKLDLQVELANKQIEEKQKHATSEIDAVSRNVVGQQFEELAAELNARHLEMQQSQEKYVQVGDVIKLKSIEGFLYSNNSHDQDEKDLLILVNPNPDNPRITWTINRD